MSKKIIICLIIGLFLIGCPKTRRMAVLSRKPLILVEYCANPDNRVYYVDQSISDHPTEKFYCPLSEKEAKYMVKLGSTGTLVVKQVTSVKGVYFFFIKPRELIVIKEAGVEWPKIEGQIVMILKRAYLDMQSI